jgi:hypothetical protein
LASHLALFPDAQATGFFGFSSNGCVDRRFWRERAMTFRPILLKKSVF